MLQNKFSLKNQANSCYDISIQIKLHSNVLMIYGEIRLQRSNISVQNGHLLHNPVITNPGHNEQIWLIRIAL